MKESLKNIFNDTAAGQKAFGRVFRRQLDNYSCAAAVCDTIARLYGLPGKFNESFFRKSLRINLNGAQTRRIERAVSEYLGGLDKEFVPYRGGMALGNIRHKPDGESHAVVFLAKRGQTIVYYDPLEHKIFRDSAGNMALPAEHDRLHAIHLPAIQGAGFDFWARRAEQNPYPLKKQHFHILDEKKAERNARRRAAYVALKSN